MREGSRSRSHLIKSVRFRGNQENGSLRYFRLIFRRLPFKVDSFYRPKATASFHNIISDVTIIPADFLYNAFYDCNMSCEEYYGMTTCETKYYAATDGRLFLRKPLKRIFHKMYNYENIFAQKNVLLVQLEF